MMLQANTDLERLTRFGGVGIHPASEKGFVEVVRELVTTTDINVNHTNICGWTPLIEAILLNDSGEKQQEIVRLLVEHGADTQLVDQYGVTPLAMAREKDLLKLKNSTGSRREIVICLRHKEGVHMIHAKSGDDYFLQQIVATAFTGTVHSVFKHALNIRSDGNDEIFTLATKAMDRAPNTLVIDLDTLDHLHINQQDRVSVRDNQLLIEEKLQIAIHTATRWQCQLPIYPADRTSLK